jgi:hypothetical protein
VDATVDEELLEAIRVLFASLIAEPAAGTSGNNLPREVPDAFADAILELVDLRIPVSSAFPETREAVRESRKERAR